MTFATNKETKASPPSRRHYGIYKTMATDPYLCKVGSAMMSIPYMSGYSPTRWRTTIVLAVPKKQNSKNPKDTRAVILQEGDMNRGHQIHARRLQKQAIFLKAIPAEQYAVKEGNCTTPDLVEKISLDIIRQLHLPATATFLDAQANYNQMVRSVVSLSTLRLGINPSVMACVISTLQNMTYLIQTSLGTAFGFGPCMPPLQGITQGSCFSPMFWICISAILLTIIKRYNMDATFASPISKLFTTFTAIAFVDNTKLIITDFTRKDSKTTLMHKTNFILNKWCGILRVTGGAIRPDKSRFWFIQHIWTKTGWTYASTIDTNTDIVLPDPDGHHLPVTQMEPHEAQKALGVWLTMDGNTTQHHDVLATKIRDLAGHLFLPNHPPPNAPMEGLPYHTLLFPPLSPGHHHPISQGPPLPTKESEPLPPTQASPPPLLPNHIQTRTISFYGTGSP